MFLLAIANSEKPALIENDAVIFGMLMAILGLVFYTANSPHPLCKRFYKYVPMLFHVVLMFVIGYLIRAPYFYIAVASKANIGGVASAPVVAAAFHPSLAPVGVLLAVLGYVLGTYGAYLCSLLMQYVAPM